MEINVFKFSFTKEIRYQRMFIRAILLLETVVCIATTRLFHLFYLFLLYLTLT